MDYKEYLEKNFNIDEKVIDLVQNAEKQLTERFAEIDDITAICQMKVLRAFQDNHINATHFDWSTGYGYDDAGRDAVERVYASVFGTEAALVRHRHAIRYTADRHRTKRRQHGERQDGSRSAEGGFL